MDIQVATITILATLFMFTLIAVIVLGEKIDEINDKLNNIEKRQWLK